jgi:hypothetical protein
MQRAFDKWVEGGGGGRGADTHNERGLLAFSRRGCLKAVRGVVWFMLVDGLGITSLYDQGD